MDKLKRRRPSERDRRFMGMRRGSHQGSTGGGEGYRSKHLGETEGGGHLQRSSVKGRARETRQGSEKRFRGKGGAGAEEEKARKSHVQKNIGFLRDLVKTEKSGKGRSQTTATCATLIPEKTKRSRGREETRAKG